MLRGGREISTRFYWQNLHGYCLALHKVPALLRECKRCRVRDYIMQNYMEQLDVKTICKQFLISLSTLSHTLMKEQNTTFLEMVNGCRVKKTAFLHWVRCGGTGLPLGICKKASVSTLCKWVQKLSVQT
ncbi:MAG: hypothetical protein K0R57_5728 [Paenibacillaceae bacterium]|jgi:hypothetical protein|nr:hypothetical protein [Paenibacillaceae bacterium]